MPIKEAQKTHTQHAVPQNIMDVEFKLIGDLTMRQFTYLMVFGLFAYLVFSTVVGFFKIPITLTFVMFGLAMAFVPIQERGMDEWFVNFVKAVYSPTQRVWKREPILPPAFTYQSLAMVKQELITLAPTSSRRKLEDYLHTQQGPKIIDKLDIPEKEYILKVRQAFAPVSVGVAVEDYEVGVSKEFESYQPFEPGKSPEKPQAPKQEEHAQAPKQAPAPKRVDQEKKTDKPQVQTKPQEEARPHQAPPAIVSPQAPRSQPSVKAPQQKEKAQTRIVPKEEHKISSKIIMPRRTTTSTMTYSPMTPDMHIGRKFTNVLPSEGQLILPVRGEVVIATSEEISIDKDIAEKTDQLRKLLEQVQGDKDLGPMLAKKEAESKKKEPPAKVEEEKKPEAKPQEKPQAKSLGEMAIPPVPLAPPPHLEKPEHKPDVKFIKERKRDGPKLDLAEIRREARDKRLKVDEAKRKQKEALTASAPLPQEGELTKAQEVAERVKQENESLTGEINRLKGEINTSQDSEETKAEKRKVVEQLEQERNKKSSDYSALQQQVLELQKRLAEKEAPQKAEGPAKPTYAKMEPITSEPNIVSGVIKSSENEAITGAVLLVKNNKGEAVRALKTNALGQFSISTPLMNGIYTLEVGSAVEDTTFDIITIEVKGEVLPPIELIGREV